MQNVVGQSLKLGEKAESSGNQKDERRTALKWIQSQNVCHSMVIQTEHIATIFNSILMRLKVFKKFAFSPPEVGG